ncbi:MAG: Crp/Fnr family transcriptional regulator [Salibacteraceae bacterium]
MEAVREYFNDVPEFTQTVWEAFSEKLEKVIIPKKSTIVELEDTENYIWFIESGDARFVIPSFEEDLTFGFAFSNEFFSAYDSFIAKEPCAYQIKAISECVTYRIHRDDLEELYATIPNAAAIGRQMAEESFIRKKKREMSFLIQSAEERYLELFTSKPTIIKTMPLKYVASFIGVTPQALSRIRARIVA